MRFNGTTRRGLGSTAAAVAAMAALTASQAPQLAAHEAAPKHRQKTDDVVWSEVPNDDSYHTELPPLKSPKPPKKGEKQSPAAKRTWAEAGIPATVLAAYRKAEATIGRSDLGCRLPWQLLAAIGKVESGHAAGGRVDEKGTTVSPILGPVLNGAGFAHIPDSDGGAYDGDATYDRAVGPMQFIPSTWAHWGRDGNGDGRRDPNNVYDAALAAGAYLCAGTRDLSVPSDMNRAILSYNHSEAYLRTVLSWLEFYRKGIHPVTDGTGPIPRSPGAGSPRKPEHPVGGSGADDDGGGGIEVGPQPTPSTRPTAPGTHDPDPGTTPDPDPTDTTGPSPDPTDTGSATPDPSTTPDPDPTTPKPDPGCTTTPAPEPTDTTEPTGSPSPGPATNDEPCTTPTLPPTAD
ncbi:lytic transglycosylase domain-containing protein [Streptomyces sp. SID9727]|uniref:lytic transglycosylase domain-containing protein n=1 Tax=Streptomyces sp. SID9727 TaxID=2706114 RepID=UPI0013C5CDC1|nr:lytic transglycosylase domain-containing protein [Streptomyces sp. SID9727]NEC63471.1 lytic transglycosylase domain-containing protein [Streptomyces sp. SID9727]